jgi:demethylmenaquinone methyltransferase/2-methoxy-6-polyprenyl-1,4-benzoquinol methylase
MPARARYVLKGMADSKDKADETASFGFADVPADEKSRLVGRIFSSVARKYDLMNDLMSGGVHRLWRETFLDWLAPRGGLSYLDVAGGTGDIAFRIFDRLAARGESASFTISDINADMLGVGQDRATAHGGADAYRWICANAERLPIGSGEHDIFTIAFGIRNVTNIDRALSEAHRVLRPGGRFMCLEFSSVNVPVLDSLYDYWSFNVIPAIGEQVTDDRAAYQYLVESIRRFPDQKRFAAMITKAGFTQVKVRNLTGGVAAIHSAWKL